MLALTLVTAVQRFVKVWRQANAGRAGPPPPERPGVGAPGGLPRNGARPSPAGAPAGGPGGRPTDGAPGRSLRRRLPPAAGPPRRWHERRRPAWPGCAGKRGTSRAPVRPGGEPGPGGPERHRSCPAGPPARPSWKLRALQAGSAISGILPAYAGGQSPRRRPCWSSLGSSLPGIPGEMAKRREIVGRHLLRVCGPGVGSAASWPG